MYKNLQLSLALLLPLFLMFLQFQIKAYETGAAPPVFSSSEALQASLPTPSPDPTPTPSPKPSASPKPPLPTPTPLPSYVPRLS